MEEESKKITKIVVSRDDELTDIITGILESKNERIILTFAEESDLLISPINLKVILETADEQEKFLIAQIIKNGTGVRNANAAGLTTIETTTLPTEDIWNKEIQRRTNRLSPRPENKFEEEKPNIQESSKEEHYNEGISIDNDIPITVPPVVKEPSELPKEHLRTTNFREKTTETISGAKKQLSKIKIPLKTKKLLLIIFVGIFSILGLASFIYYKTAPLVRIRIYIQSKEASIEKIFVGDQNIKEVDFENSKIPIKKESVEKARSTTVQATGTAFKGEKATGTVLFVYFPSGDCPATPVNIPQGQTVLSDGNKTFKTDSAMAFSCDKSSTTVGITAADIGEEYNLPVTSFTVQGFSANNIKGTSTQPTTGGSKTQYTVLSQADVNTATEELKKIAIQEGEQELKDKSGGSWEIIPGSIKSDVVKDSAKTGVAVGAETKETSLELKTTSEATYFLKDGFDSKISELLTQEAQAKNLFETDKDLELTLSNDVQKEISVVENTPDSTKIKLIAKASVKPKVEKEVIVNELKGKKWNEGNEILKKYIFSDKTTEVVFEPQNFPEKLKYFPSRHGGIMLELKEVL